jgi:hypothetical protein
MRREPLVSSGCTHARENGTLQALNSTKTLMNDGMEREHLVRLQESINQHEEGRLRLLDRIYEQLLHENGCLSKKNRVRKSPIGCKYNSAADILYDEEPWDSSALVVLTSGCSVGITEVGTNR